MADLNTFQDSIEKLTIVSERYVGSYMDGYINKEVYEVLLSDGSIKKCERIKKRGKDGDAVVIIPIVDNGKYVMIVESRPNVRAGIAIEFPAGMIDENEKPIDAAMRELKEETGYECEDLYLIDSYYQDHGCSRGIVYVFLAQNCKRVTTQNLDDDEKIDVYELEYDDVLDLMKNSNVNEVGIVDSGTKNAFMCSEMKRRGIL